MDDPRILFAWESLKLLANSEFATSLVGALAGAFAGATAAQRMAERSKLREELTKEIRNINAGITIAFSIVNTMLALKKQHVRGLKAAYDDECARFDTYVAKLKSDKALKGEVFHLQMDFRSLPQILPPASTLQSLVFERISVTGRPLSLTASLLEAIEHLNDSILRRNDLIADFKKGGGSSLRADLKDMYLGLPDADGNVNQEYRDTISAIASHTDDAIFLGNLLCTDLRKYGLEVAERFSHLFRDAAPRVTEVDFATARESGLLPNDEEYSTWFTAFQTAPETRRSWWKRAT